MDTSRLFVVFFIIIFKTTNCVPIGKNDRDVKFRLLSLLTPTDDLPQVIEDPSIDIRNNFIIGPDYLPSYKSKENFLYKRDDNYEPQKGGFKNGKFAIPGLNSQDSNSNNDYLKPQGGFQNGKFAIPWLNAQDEESSENNDDSLEFNKNSASFSEKENRFDEFKQTKKMDKYEVKEQRGEHEHNYYPSMVHHIQAYPQLYPGKNYGFRSVPGFYQGFGLHYHHNHDFHHQHSPDCFGNRRRRPRPPPPPPPPPTVAPRPTGAPISIDPRVSTLAGIISTEASGIDIRVGRDTRDRDDRIVFPE